MNGQNKPSLVIICVSVTGTAQPHDYFLMVDNQFQGCDPQHFVKLGNGMYLANQDACYPAILELVDYCNQAKDVPGQPSARLMIAELSEFPISLSPAHQDAQALALKMGRQVKLTKFPTPAQPAPNRPV